MSAIAQTQQAISRAVAQFATHGLLPAWDMASRLSCRRRLHFAACLDTAGATPRPGLGLGTVKILRTFRQPHRPAIRYGYSSSSVTSR